MVNDLQDIIEQIALLLILESLAIAGDAEGLAREAGTKDVVRGNMVVFEYSRRALQVDVFSLSDVTIWQHAVICCIRIPSLLIPVGRPYAFSPCFLEGIVKPPDSAEEVNEGRLEGWHSRIGAYFAATSRPNRQEGH